MWKLSDESLLAGFASKDPEVTAAFVRRFQGRVFGLALTIVKDAAVAEEIAQETMARAWEHAGAYDSRKGRVDTWLLTIARNLSIDARRVRSREVTTYDDAELLRIISTEPDPEGRGVLADEKRRLREAIVGLSEEQRRALLLATFRGLSGREISEAEGIPLGTAKTRLHAAMLNLRAARGRAVTGRPECPEVRLLLPELALGTLTGHERGWALEHLGGCPDCRRELQSLSEVADEMLLLAPSAGPPVGFESRVLDRVGATRGARLRESRWVAAVAAALAAALIGGAVVYAIGAADRELAGNYRATLAVADGEYFAARPLESGDGSEAGHVFGYQGSPSWVFCVVSVGTEEGSYDIEITAIGGDTWSAGEMQIEAGKGTWAQPLGVDLHDVLRLRLVDRSTGETLVATW